MTKVMLVRHGETDWNRKEVFRGRIDVELNQNGREQARALAEATRIFQIDAIYSSPLSRSLETAKFGQALISHLGLWKNPGNIILLPLFGFTCLMPFSPRPMWLGVCL